MLRGRRGPSRFLPGLLLPAALLALLCAGCGRTAMDRLMPHVERMYTATHYFGPPAKQTPLPGGGTKNEWLMDKVTQTPGQYVEERVRIGTDSDGFPVYRIREVFVPAHMARRWCRLEILADKSGAVLKSSWEGNACEEIMRVPATY